MQHDKPQGESHLRDSCTHLFNAARLLKDKSFNSFQVMILSLIKLLEIVAIIAIGGGAAVIGPQPGTWKRPNDCLCQ
ncbi:hypothetical protein SDC9_210702 [bioreactor metagenome]|uniref:Uncharacterized protein n=1 Tax=bioreactor metagenome TaxID=1076179 RepID=A0A645JJQ8_9ZZZZ